MKKKKKKKKKTTTILTMLPLLKVYPFTRAINENKEARTHERYYLHA